MKSGDNDLIIKMAQAMTKGASGPSGVEGIYTYFGQLIAHDIVENTNKANSTRKVTSALNLDSIYGNQSPYAYQFNNFISPFFNGSKFSLRCYPDDKPKTKHKIFDFPRKRQGSLKRNNLNYLATIPDSRNDENIIVSQLHILFLRFHNFLIEEGLARNALEARKLVVIVFQWITYYEFLPKILHPSVYEMIVKKGISYHRNWDKSETPLFFSMAAFRFGHSIVRPAYTIVDHDTIGKRLVLEDMFRKGKKLDPLQKIGWRNFFDRVDDEVSTYGKRNNAPKIDTNITDGMTKVNNKSTDFGIVNVIERNLVASSKIGIESGYQMYGKIIEQNQERDLDSELNLELIKDFGESEFKNISGLDISSLQLWPYLLLEAEISMKGLKLGSMGSILVAEVLRNAMFTSDISIFDSATKMLSRENSIVEEKLNGFININSSESLILQIEKLCGY